MGLRRGDAGAEGLRAVLPAVDLLDGPDKDPFAGRRQAKPGGVERVNVSRFTGFLRQDPPETGNGLPSYPFSGSASTY